MNIFQTISYHSQTYILENTLWETHAIIDSKRLYGKPASNKIHKENESVSGIKLAIFEHVMHELAWT